MPHTRVQKFSYERLLEAFFGGLLQPVGYPFHGCFRIFQKQVIADDKVVPSNITQQPRPVALGQGQRYALWQIIALLQGSGDIQRITIDQAQFEIGIEAFGNLAPEGQEQSHSGIFDG